MRRLAGAAELLDGPLDDPAVLRGNLRDLGRVNRWLGGADLSWRAVRDLVEAGRGTSRGTGAPRASVSVLDVGTGAADIPLALLAGAGRAGVAMRVTGIDARAEVLSAAVALRPQLAVDPRLELHVSDGRSLPYGDASFDVVHGSLLLHHLEPDEAVAFLREAARVARTGVVVNDLVRARRHWLAARALFAVTTRNRYTRHDGPLSVRRAYTLAELTAMLREAGLRLHARHTGIVGHRIALAAVHEPARRLTRAEPPG